MCWSVSGFYIYIVYYDTIKNKPEEFLNANSQIIINLIKSYALIEFNSKLTDTVF